MKSKIIFFSFIVFSVLLASPIYAAFTVSPSLPTKSLTENQQVTVTVTVTNPSGGSTETNVVTSLSSGSSWFSVVSDCNAINSLSAGQSGTSTCIIKPTSTGSDLSLTASSTSQAGTTGSGSTSGINVASQSSSLTASVSSVDSSVSTGATFYVGVTVTAPSANDVVNARTTISESGQCTVDTSYVPAQQTLGNITKGTSKSPTNWKLTASSASGTCTATINVVSDVGGTGSPSKSITVGSTSSGSSDSSSSSSGGGGGGAGGGDSGGGTSKVAVSINEGGKNAIIIIPSIAAKSQANFSISSPVIAITEMKIKTLTSVSSIKISVNKLGGIPTGVLSNAPGVTNQYLEITPNASIAAGDIEKVTINFKVEKDWIANNSINESSIAMYRYTNEKWNKLDTNKINDDGTNLYYQSTSPGFSIFSISGESKSSAPQGQSPSGVNKTREKQPGNVANALKKDSWKIILIVLCFVFTAAVFIYFFKIRPHLSPSRNKIS